MTDRSALCDRIRTAPNATIANRLADEVQGDFSDMRDRLAAVLDD